MRASLARIAAISEQNGLGRASRTSNTLRAGYGKYGSKAVAVLLERYTWRAPEQFAEGGANGGSYT